MTIKQDRLLLIVLISFLAALIFMGLFSVDPVESFKGFLRLQISPARLLVDFMAAEGIGAAFLNAALVGALGLTLILLNKVTLSGPVFAAVFTLVGFGLFGKTPVNALPIFIGVALSARLVNKRFKDYIIIALFGTALGPLITYLAVEAFNIGAFSWLIAIPAGMATGFLLPPLAVAMLHLHQGYNLYNMGLTCGFFGLFAAGLFRIASRPFPVPELFAPLDSLAVSLFIPILSVLLLVTGLISGKADSFKHFKKILTQSGRLPSDFVEYASFSGTLLNVGLIGIFGSVYVFAVGAAFSGPVIGGLLTIMGFGAFGTHVKNSWPVVLGVVLCAFIFKIPLNEPGPVLAAIFCTTLAPLAGQFGIGAGILAGFIHLLMVMQTGSWHGGMNLYNNGFAGGLTAAIIIAVIQWYRTNRNEF